VSQTITLQLPDGLSEETVACALDEAGFDVVHERAPTVSTSTTRARMTLVRAASHLSNILSRKQQKHAEQCLLCSSGAQAPEHDLTAHTTGALRQNVSTPTAVSVPTPDRIYGSSTVAGNAPISATPAQPPAMREISLSIGGMTCASCANSITRALQDLTFVRDVNISVLSHSGKCTVSSGDLSDKVVEAIEDCGFEAEIVDIRPIDFSSAESTPRADDPTSLDGPYILLLSIGGMTCASCSNAIVDTLKTMEGISNVHVNLLGNSASLVVSDRKLESSAIDAIEDIGYEVGAPLTLCLPSY
jgi:Cu+-exporting ATPase